MGKLITITGNICVENVFSPPKSFLPSPKGFYHPIGDDSIDQYVIRINYMSG